MRLHGTIDLHVRGERILRRANLWDKLKTAFGAHADLDTLHVRAAFEATAVVDASHAALKRLGVTNAISLVIDDHSIFHDAQGRPDDLGDLFLAFHESAPVFGAGFSLLRLAAEHEEAGLHLVLEIVARTEHPVGEGAGRVVVSGRIRDLEPRKDEGAEAYRARIEPLLRDPLLLEAHRRQFESFVARACEAIRSAMPEARVEIRSAEAQIERPAKRPRANRDVHPPTDPRYDPYDRYYPDPFGGLYAALMWSAIGSMHMAPAFVIVDEIGDAIGHPGDDGEDGGGSDGSDGEGDGDDDDDDDGGDAGDDLDDFDGGDFGDY